MAGGMGSWFGGAAAQARQAAAQARQAAAQARASGMGMGGMRGGDDDVVDTTGTVKPDAAGELPSGRGSDSKK